MAKTPKPPFDITEVRIPPNGTSIVYFSAGPTISDCAFRDQIVAAALPAFQATPEAKAHAAAVSTARNLKIRKAELEAKKLEIDAARRSGLASGEPFDAYLQRLSGGSATATALADTNRELNGDTTASLPPADVRADLARDAARSPAYAAVDVVVEKLKVEANKEYADAVNEIVKAVPVELLTKLIDAKYKQDLLAGVPARSCGFQSVKNSAADELLGGLRLRELNVLAADFARGAA